MRQVIYFMQFHGTTAPGRHKGAARVEAIAASCNLYATIDGEGLNCNLTTVVGQSAKMQSKVEELPDGRFREQGSITFGEGGHRLHFSTFTDGCTRDSGNQGDRAGSITWQVDGGEGQFEGARGLITGNFVLTATGELIDYQTGVLYLRPE